MGVKAQHIPGRNIGESIDRLVYDMETLLKDNAGVNLEQKGQQLFFNLWKCHQWGEYTLYFIPVIRGRAESGTETHRHIVHQRYG